MSKMLLPLLGAAALAASACSAAPRGGGGLRQACRADFQKLCANPTPGERPIRCLVEHRDQLSPACKSALDQARAAHAGS
ncbi:MAG: cysteine rich repeat-containing protein [Caulobacteraceae bacterium]